MKYLVGPCVAFDGCDTCKFSLASGCAIFGVMWGLLEISYCIEGIPYVLFYIDNNYCMGYK
jgi:hypothetical protein